MKTTALVLTLAALFGLGTGRAARAGKAPPRPPDPLTTDPDKYSLVLENEHVRVLRYHDRPGDKTHPHYHRRFVLVVMAPFRRRLIFPDGRTQERDFKAGEVIWMEAQTHTGENIGTTDTEVLLVEVK